MLPFARHLLGEEYSNQIGSKGPDQEFSYKYDETVTIGYLGQDERSVYKRFHFDMYTPYQSYCYIYYVLS